MSCTDLALDIAAGLAGWLQLQIVQRLGGLSGEDSARLVVAQIVNAQGSYEPATSQLPPNWGSTKKRVDIALKARSAGAETWYGAVEIKWPGDAFDVAKMRDLVVQDAMRLTFIDTNGINAHLLVLGGSTKSFEKLFDDPHPSAKVQEARRKLFQRIFSRNLKQATGEATHAEWSELFPDAGNRVPESVFANFQGKLKTELLARARALVRGERRGSVFVWQCNLYERDSPLTAHSD